jgi:hypothetical protein
MTIEAVIPLAKYCPTSKHWWSHELTTLCKEVNRAAAKSHKARALPNHPSHDQQCTLRNKYSDTIKKTKLAHWIDWLEGANMANVWIANKYLNAEPSDGELIHIPMLKT